MTKSEHSFVASPAVGRLLAQSIIAARAGKRERARHLLGQLIRQDPTHEQAWLWLAAVSENPHQVKACLRQVLRINPHNARAIQRLCQANPKRLQRHLFRRWLGIWMLVAGLVVIVSGFAAQAWVLGGSDLPLASEFVPTSTVTATDTPTPISTPTRTVEQHIVKLVPGLEQAWGGRAWKAALKILNRIALIDADYPGLDVARCDTLLRWAEDVVARDEIREAYAVYRRALGVCQDTKPVLEAKSLALTYLSGKWRHDRERWREAATTLEIVYRTDPEYADIRQLLHTAYVSWAETDLANGALAQAREAGEAALELEPEDARTTALLAEIRQKLAPTPRPTPVQYKVANKRIEVNISQQRMYVWQGDTLLYNWVCSTGEPESATATGYFRVLNKTPQAWASTWSLRMPYWMGIYQVGSLQNGIHALPIRSDGQMLWAGYLGSRVSYGCVILSTENARTLYNWTDIGTPVWIHY